MFKYCSIVAGYITVKKTTNNKEAFKQIEDITKNLMKNNEETLKKLYKGK